MTGSDDVPAFHELLWPTLEALKELGGSGTVSEIVDTIADLQGLTEEQMSVPHGDGPTSEVAYRSAWARTYLKKAGAITNSKRGVWALTEEGWSLPQEEVAAIPREVQERYREERQARRAAAREGGQEDTEESEELEDDWREKALEAILAASFDSFERLTQRLLREAGFLSVTVTGRPGDQGIDGTGLYRLALVGFPVFFQCKRYRGTVGAREVRDFRGAMSGRGDKGLLITTGTFSPEAKAEATREGAPPVDLIDGYQLCELLKDYGLGIDVTQRTVEDVEVDESFFQSLGAAR